MVLSARLASLLLAIGLITAGFASPARAALGYELDAANPTRTFVGAPRGIAVDQANQDIYVAISSSNPSAGTPGRIDRYNVDLSPDGVFATGGGFYTGVAVDPLTQNFWAAQTRIDTAFGSFGTPRLDRFSPLGASTGEFALSDTIGMPPIATDSAGNVFYPHAAQGKVLIFGSSGSLQKEITCGGCPGGSFGRPVSVAVNASDDLYVADLSPDRVVKMTLSGGTYTYSSTLQSGRGATAVGVNPATGDVFVGDMPGGEGYHIVAYTAVGVQFDDFGAGLFGDPPPEIGSYGGYQMAVNATTNKLYVGEFGKFYVFELVTIDPPSATIEPPEAVGQLTATLSATVNANGHAALECDFEYTDEADFQANGFVNATAKPCLTLPGGSADSPVNAKVSGLLPASTYRYRMTVTSNAGSDTSGAETFQTLPVVLPTVATESPLTVTETSATIRGKVNPHGGSVSDCHFEYGTSMSYGSSISCTPLPGPATTDVAASRKILALVADTAYHYRLVVTTNAGTVEGDDFEFRTAGAPSEPEPDPDPGPAPSAPPAVAPPPSTAPVAPRPLRCKKGFRKKRVRGKARCVRKKRPARRGARQGGRRG